MAQNFKIDQQATFAGPLQFLQSAPKTAMGSDQQQTTKDGVPKWEIHLLGMFHGGFSGLSPEVLKVGIAQHGDPGEGLDQNTPVIMQGLEVGVMEKTKKNPQTGEEKIIGVTVWHRAESMHPANGSAGGSGQSQAGAAAAKVSEKKAAESAA